MWSREGVSVGSKILQFLKKTRATLSNVLRKLILKLIPGLISQNNSCFSGRPEQQGLWVKMQWGEEEYSRDSGATYRPKQHSRGNCNPVKDPAVSDVKLI